MVAPRGISFGHLLDPLPYDDLGFLKTLEDLGIQKVIPEGAIKAFTKAILPGRYVINLSGFPTNSTEFHRMPVVSWIPPGDSATPLSVTRVANLGHNRPNQLS